MTKVYMSNDLIDIKVPVCNKERDEYYKTWLEEDFGPFTELSEEEQTYFGEMYDKTVEVELDWVEMFKKNNVNFDMNCPEFLKRRGKEDLFNLVIKDLECNEKLNNFVWRCIMNHNNKTVKTSFNLTNVMGYMCDIKGGEFETLTEFLDEVDFTVDDACEWFLTDDINYRWMNKASTEFTYLMDLVKDEIMWSIDEDELGEFCRAEGINVDWDEQPSPLCVLLDTKGFYINKEQPIVLDFYNSITASQKLSHEWNLGDFIEVEVD